MNLSGINLQYLVKELQILVNGRIDKIYNPKKEELLLQIHVTSIGKKMLRIISGKFVFLTENKGQINEPGGFCMFLRKKLGNGRIRKIEQVEGERILLIEFDSLRMYIELFGKGNIVVTDMEDNILNALDHKKWKDRTITKNVKYDYPKRDFNLFKLKKDEFIELAKGSGEIVKRLAKNMGIGGVYSEEICLISNVDKNKARLQLEEFNELYKGFSKIMKIKPKGYIVYKDNKIKDIVPGKLEVYKNFEMKEFGSFNEALDFFFKEEYEEEFVSKHQSNIDKSSKIVEQQEKQVRKLEKKSEEDNKKGELIYEKYQVVEEILKEINLARKKFSFKEIKEKLKGHKVVKDINEKEKKVIVEL